MAIPILRRLRQLIDVDAPSIAAGQTLVWDPGAGKFVGAPLGGAETDPVASAALTSAVATLNAALALKQAASSAATDAELAAAVAAVDASVSDVQAAVDALSDAGATDVELAAAVGVLTSVISALDTRVAAVESDGATGLPSKASRAANLSDLASASAARGNLGLGSAATQASSAFDAAGVAAAGDAVLAARRRVLGEYSALTVGSAVFAGELTTVSGVLYARIADGTISGTFTPANWTALGGAVAPPAPDLFGSDTPAGVGLDAYPSVLSFTAIGDHLLIRNAANETQNFSGPPYSRFTEGAASKRTFDSLGRLKEQDKLFRSQPKLSTIPMPDGLGTVTPGAGIVCTGLADAGDGVHLWVGNGASGTEAAPQPDNCSVVKMTRAGVKVTEYGMGAIFGNATSVQGIAVDKSDGTLWVAQTTAGQVRHMTTAGVNAGGGFALAGANGLTYDSFRDRLLCVAGQVLTRRTKAGVVEATLDLTTVAPTGWDHAHYDADRDWVWVTHGDNGSAGELRAFDAATFTAIGTTIVPDVTAIEGMTILDGQFWVCHDGGFHTAAVIALNQIQVYPAVRGSARIAWPIDFDPVTLSARGYLIEPAFAQLAGYNIQFDNAAWAKVNAAVTANAVTSPTGSQDADTITATASTGFHNISRQVAGAAVPYVTAVIAKMGTHRYLWTGDRGDTGGVRSATFDLQAGTVVGASRDTGHIRDLGNGWYRCERRGTRSSANNVSVYIAFGAAAHTQDYPSATLAGTETMHVFLAECGQASYATSPVVGDGINALTRVADVPTIALSALSWSPTANTLILKGRTPRAAGAHVALQVDDGTANERIRLEHNASSELRLIVTDGGIEQANLLLGTVGVDTDIRVAIRVAVNDFAASLNGAAVVADANGTLPSTMTLRLGHSVTVGEQWASTVLSLIAIPEALPNATLQALVA